MFAKSKTLWVLMRGQRLRYFGAFGAMAASVLTSYVVPVITASFIDVIKDAPLRAGSHTALLTEWLGGRDVLRSHFWMCFVGIVAFTALSGAFGYLRGVWTARACESVTRRLRNRLYDHLQRLPAAYHDHTPTGDLVQRCTSDVETINGFLSNQVVEIVRAILMVAFVLPFMIALSPSMTLLAMALMPVIVMFAAMFFTRVRKTFKVHDEAEGKMTTVIQENLSGIRVVRAFARQDFECGKFGQANARFRDTGFNVIKLHSVFWSSTDCLAIAQHALVLFVGTYWVLTGPVTVGVLVAFLAYESRIMWPVRQMGRILTDLGQTLVSLGRVHDILDAQAETAPSASALQPAPPPAATLGRLTGAIRFTDLRFAFGAQAVLEGVTFDVPAGQTVALLGPSGSGKSTLIHLLLRLYDYTAGSITLDGRELSGLDRQFVRSQIGVVLQEPFLYSKTLRENISIAHAHATDEGITEAAALACIDESIESFEDGYNTLVGERGVMLSGGQRQRVALARAVLKDPPILILDDALSAVDTRTESLILAALRRRHARRTTLIIAHRLSTLMQADRIVVLDRGRVAQIGTHAELVSREGLYRRLWMIQSSLEEELSREVGTGTDPAGPPAGAKP